MLKMKAKDIDFSRFAFDAQSSWGRCLLAWLRQCHERSGSMHTLIHYQQIVTDFFSDPVKMPDAYNRDDVDRYIHSGGRGNGREGNSPGPGSVNNRLSCLSSFYAYAAAYTVTNEQGAIQAVMRVIAPTTGIRQLKRPRSYHALSATEVERFFSVIPRTENGLKYRALFMTYLYTARRKSEIVDMRFGDIERTTIMENGQPREMFTYCFYGKGRKRIRDTAELPSEAAAAIFAYLEFSGRLKGIQPDHAIFTSDTSYRGRMGYDPMRPLNESVIWVTAKRYAKQAGLDENIVTVHMFRHVSAKIRYESGSDIREIQQLLRHASLQTTDVYLRQMITVQDNGAKFLSARFGNL